VLWVVLPVTLSALPSVDVSIEIVVLIKIIIVVDIDVSAVPIAIAPMAAPSTPRGGAKGNSCAPR
jgi:hypothetical protein